ncbi:MAG: hypothetical protein ACXVAY_00765 [Mucilaginibacter sp.]
MTAIEHKELKGITIKNLIVTVLSTASIVVSVMTCYFQLKNDIYYIKTQVDTQYRINEIRLKVLEQNVTMLQQQVTEIKNQHQFKTNYKK